MAVEAQIPGDNAWHPAVVLDSDQGKYDLKFTEYPHLDEERKGIKRRCVRPLVRSLLKRSNQLGGENPPACRTC